MATACAPTGNRRKRAPELLARAWAERWNDGTTESAVATKTAWARPIPSFRRCIVRSAVFRLIDQHDRDVVFDRGNQAAGLADELLLRRGEVLQRTLLLGAAEYHHQGRRHTRPPY